MVAQPIPGPEVLQEAEDAVLHNKLEAKVTILGKVRTLRPLPQYYARRLSGVITKINKAFAEYNEKSDTEKLQMASAFAGQEELICSTICEAIAGLSEFYEWADVTADALDRKMLSTELLAILDTQSKLNGRNDFLLVSYRTVSQSVLSVIDGLEEQEEKRKAAAAKRRSSPDSETSGASAPSPS